MNATKDLSILSYKELQALAVKHRVPGNIKKHHLLEILDAINRRDNSEVTRLLSDLKKNRKKRTKRAKIMKTDEDATLQMNLQNNSPNLPVLQDHYLFPMPQQHQQQYPFQWLSTPQVGAEEEVGTSKFDDSKCSLSYNDFQQFVLYTSQSVYGNCDTNNNSTLLDEIMDLRTEATVSNYRSSLDINHINTSDQQSIIQQPVDDNASKKMSLLLKKMLQAPVGANLGEIASPVSTWNMDTYRMREQSPDNSETMTAKSDINENDEIWQDSVTGTGLPYVFENEQSYSDNPYCSRNNNASYYRLPLDNVVEQSSLGYEPQTCIQYQLSFTPQSDAQENCRSWLASNSLDISSPAEYNSTSRFITSDTTLAYQSSDNLDIMNSSPGDSNIVQQSQYCLSDQLYGTQASTGLLEPSEIVPDLSLNTSPYYQQSTSLVRSEEPPDYYRQICDTNETSGFGQDFYEPPQQHQQSNQQQPTGNQSQHCCDYTQQLAEPIYHVDLDSGAYATPGYYQEQAQQQPCRVSNQPSGDPLQQVQAQAPPQPQPQPPSQQYDSYATPANVQTNPPPYGAAVLDSYWPRWTYEDIVSQRMGGRMLENTLNLCSQNYVDYEKLNKTCCVYSNKTPVMTLRKGLNSTTSDHEIRNSNVSTSSEYRQHNFSSNWLLYNEDATEIVRRNSTPPTNSIDTGYFSPVQDQDSECIF